MSRLEDAFLNALLVLLLLCLAAAIFIAGAKLGNAVAVHDQPTTCGEQHTPSEQEARK